MSGPRSGSVDTESQTAELVGTLWVILIASLAVHMLSLFAARWWFADLRWAQTPFHSTIEMAGAIVAMGVAWMLLSLERLRAGTSYNTWIASALVGMGVLDALHGMVEQGQTFVWLHSLATLTGGVLFAMVWLPRDWQQHARSWPWIVLAISLTLGLGSIFLDERVPAMTESGLFTPLALQMNIVGGALMFSATARMVLTYRSTGNSDDLLFCLHCGLFGAAAIMFQQSKLWDLPWWGWHFLRLMAYGVALWFVVKTDARTAKALRRRAADQARVQAIKENADQLEQANAKLRREQHLINSLVNTIPDAVFFKDRQGRIIRANESMAKDAGFNCAEELIGKTDREIWSGDLYAKTAVDEQRIMETGQAMVNKEETPIREGGEPRWVLVTKMPLYDEEGQIMGVFGVARDITEIKLQEFERERQAQALAKAKEALERSNTDLQQFAYVASHDLQEPLRAVAGHCQLLEIALGDNASDRVKTFLHHAVDGAKRMQELINNLLDYSRVESRGREMVATDINDVVNDAMKNLAVAIDEHDAVIERGDLPVVNGDRDQLVQLFQNLIGNAIKFCGEETPEIQIDAVREKDDRETDRWLFSVSDNGIGLEREYQDRIFVIFQRLHARTQYPGTGLGLAIAKRIVERHRGRIWVDSQPGAGSTFYFTLPPA
ncbi:Phytochrome-like protein cph1 [Stieleria maiorica]|uniref:histidine kinase n=1 Tax=Stieleria maiorica TaxID=2795974 RepID=A0A5B9MAW9_9BACT|nr:ATP-binding protein [Stieleria maiorica]QEF97669.1 Phytochrome-like protein cph1 [Stieleria maiorica]